MTPERIARVQPNNTQRLPIITCAIESLKQAGSNRYTTVHQHNKCEKINVLFFFLIFAKRREQFWSGPPIVNCICTGLHKLTRVRFWNQNYSKNWFSNIQMHQNLVSLYFYVWSLTRCRSDKLNVLNLKANFTSNI